MHKGKDVIRETDIPSVYYECRQAIELNNVESSALLAAKKHHSFKTFSCFDVTVQTARFAAGCLNCYVLMYVL